MQLISETTIGDIPLYNTTYIKNLQKQVDKKVAKSVNALLASKKNDLALCFNEEVVWKLGMYYNILEQISYCNSCFDDGITIEEVINLTKNQLTLI